MEVQTMSDRGKHHKLSVVHETNIADVDGQGLVRSIDESTRLQSFQVSANASKGQLSLGIGFAQSIF